ncbi:MAG TPA: Spy/CpxP family protein refolding chaperone [Bryobacteraceae bacterium]|nr:Spy/CpxP family protein refolding chaperone [Bryobacteraceae bacterium]
MTALALASSGGLALAQGPEGMGEGPGPGFGGPGMMGGSMARMDRAERIARELKLKGDQKTQVKTILQTSSEQSRPLQMQLVENRQALSQLVTGGAADFDQQLEALVKTQASLTSQITALQVKGLVQVWNLLTPEQKKKAEEHPELFSVGMPGMAGMQGRMGGRGMGGERPMEPGGPPEM